METKTIQTRNLGAESPIANANTIHGIFNIETGELISFTATNYACTRDYTNNLTLTQILACRKELKNVYKAKYGA